MLWQLWTCFFSCLLRLLFKNLRGSTLWRIAVTVHFASIFTRRNKLGLISCRAGFKIFKATELPGRNNSWKMGRSWKWKDQCRRSANGRGSSPLSSPTRNLDQRPYWPCLLLYHNEHKSHVTNIDRFKCFPNGTRRRAASDFSETICSNSERVGQCSKPIWIYIYIDIDIIFV